MSETENMSQISKKQFRIDFLYKYASIGDLKNVKKLVEENKLDINSMKYSLTALAVCAANSGKVEVIEYLLTKGAEIRDSHLHSIKAGNTETAEVLLSHLSKTNPYLEMSPVKDSAVFPQYMTPLMLAAICGHQSIIELLMFRGHTIPIPHMSHCECDDCTVSSTNTTSKSQRNLDIYRALCNPVYIYLNSSDPITKAFELENETRVAIEKSNYFSHHYKDMFRKMENYVIDVINKTRDAEEVKILLKQKGAKNRPNSYIIYPALQNAIDQKWIYFIASKQIENLRTHLWLGDSNTWFRSGIDGFRRKLFNIFFIILGQLIVSFAFAFRYKRHITAQSRYLCRLFNESVFVFVLLLFLTQNHYNYSLHLTLKIGLIIWTIANIVNMAKKFAILGPRNSFKFYGNVFELIITSELILSIITIFSCDASNYLKVCEDNNSSDSGSLTCLRLNYIVLAFLMKLIYLRLIFLSSLRAYKGTHEHLVIHFFLLSFCLISVFYPLFSKSIGHISHFSEFHKRAESNMFGDNDPMFTFVIINFFIGLMFEITKGPEKIADKYWCYHWTARLINEIHGSCELTIPFNIMEIHRVFLICVKRDGLRRQPTEEDIKQYNQIRNLVYARYDCLTFLNSKHNSEHTIY